MAKNIKQRISKLLVLASDQSDNGLFEEAIKNFDKVIELEPINVTALNKRGYAKNQIEHYNDRRIA